MATMNVLDSTGGTVAIEKPLTPGTAADSASRPVAFSTEGKAQFGIVTETAPASDTASSGLNGRLQRIAQRLTSLIALHPTALGSAAAAASLAVTQSTEDIARAGIITETAPASDTASSGLNGRLQRIAQRITSMIALLPAALGAGGGLKVQIYNAAGSAVDPNTNGTAADSASAPVAFSTEGKAQLGALTETAPASDTASSGINGRLQRIAQRITATLADLVAHDGADAGSPLKVGGRARSSEIAAVANNDRSDFLTDLVGKLIVLPYANPENFVSGAITSAMTGTTSTSLIAAPALGLRNYITQITVSNAHGSVGTDVAIQDGLGGTTLYTIPAAAVYGGAVVTFPTPLRQPTTATAIFCANVTTGASTKVSASGYNGA